MDTGGFSPAASFKSRIYVYITSHDLSAFLETPEKLRSLKDVGFLAFFDYF